ncbi:MAG: hypothetical protein ACOYMN_01620 [Roseimicrobium sp.]
MKKTDFEAITRVLCDADMDWSLTTWKGSRREQHREFHALSFAQKLKPVEEMEDLILQLQAHRLTAPPTDRTADSTTP